MVAVADDDQIIAAFVGEFHDGFGGVTGAAFAGDFNAVPFCHFRDFLFSLLEIIGGGFGFALGFAGQIRVAGQRLPHPDGGQLGMVVFGGDGGAFQCGLSAFRSVIAYEDFCEHNDLRKAEGEEVQR